MFSDIKMHARKKVVIVQRIVPEYREALFKGLQEELTSRGIELVILEGEVLQNEALTSVGKRLSFVKPCKTIYFPGGLHWITGITSACWNADLLILEQASSALHLYWSFLMKCLRNNLPGKRGRLKIALWGHGVTSANKALMSFRNKWKTLWTRQTDYCFAYTDISAKLFMEMGIAPEKIQILRNTHDIDQIRKFRSELFNSELIVLKKKLFGQYTDVDCIRTGIFCGRLNQEKWIPFLLEAISHIHHNMPNFRMLIIGDGEYADKIRTFCSSEKWCIWLGAKHGDERVKYMALADIWLHPGATGLAIVDSFALGIPFITTDNKMHRPEISYLQHFHNGIIAPPDVKQYAEMVIYVLENNQLFSSLKQNAFATGETLTISQMISNFCNGIYTVLSIPTTESTISK